jgi:hypothetical protein
VSTRDGSIPQGQFDDSGKRLKGPLIAPRRIFLAAPAVCAREVRASARRIGCPPMGLLSAYLFRSM